MFDMCIGSCDVGIVSSCDGVMASCDGCLGFMCLSFT